MLLEYLTISLRHLLLIINEAAVALNTPMPTPSQVLDYMRSVPRYSLFLNPEKRLTAKEK